MTLESNIRIILNVLAIEVRAGQPIEDATERAADAILAHLYPLLPPPQLPISDVLGDDCSPR